MVHTCPAAVTLLMEVVCLGKVDYPSLPAPEAMFDMRYFIKNPKPFFDFACEIYPGNFRPAASHRFIEQLEAHGCLLRNYTQNIDTLEQVCAEHSIFATFCTISCFKTRGYAYTSSDLKTGTRKEVICNPVFRSQGGRDYPGDPVSRLVQHGIVPCLQVSGPGQCNQR